MVIREAERQLDISGSPAELNVIADRVEDIAVDAALSIVADATPDPRPYDRCLASLELRATGGPVRVAVSQNRVVVTGSAPMLGAFSSFFRFDSSASRGTHHHHEWFDGNDYVAPDSSPLVVSVG